MRAPGGTNKATFRAPSGEPEPVPSPTQEDVMAFQIGKSGVQLQFSEMLDGTFVELLAELVQLGALVSIGASRDQAALKVTVTVNGEWDFDWFRTDEELHAWLKLAVAAVLQQMEATPALPSTKSRRVRGALKPV